jgi:hypothetical protein
VFFHVDGVTGGMYLMAHKYRQRKKGMRNESFFAAACVLFSYRTVDFFRVGSERTLVRMFVEQAGKG